MSTDEVQTELPSDPEDDSVYEDSGSESGTSNEEDDDERFLFPFDEAEREIGFLLTPSRPPVSLSIGSKAGPAESLGEDVEGLAPIRAIQTELELKEVGFDLISDWGVGWGLRWQYGGLEKFGRIVDALNACRLVSLAVDFGPSDDSMPWSSDAAEVFCDRLELPGLRALDMGVSLVSDGALVAGIPKLLDRHPNLQHLTLPVITRTNYGAFLHPLIRNSTSLLAICPHGQRGASSSLFSTWSTLREVQDPTWVLQPWCTCGRVSNPKGTKWAKKWSAPILRNRFLRRSMRRGTFGTIASARILWNARKGHETASRSILDLPAEVLSVIAHYASPCPWALSQQQLVRVISLATDTARLNQLHRDLPSDSTRDAAEAWVVENGIVWDGGVELADAIFAD